MPDFATPHSPRTAGSASSSSAISIGTLFLTACASAAAAYTCSKVWAPGTLASAAFTPVLVAVIKEALARPTAVVARAVPVRGVVRSARAQGSAQTLDQGSSASSSSDALGGDHEAPVSAASSWSPDSTSLSSDDPASRVAQSGEIQYHGSKRFLRGWRLAVVTGLLGFLICAVVFTVPELVAGGSAAGGGRDTTIFGGGKQHSSSKPAVTTQTTTAPTNTVTTPPATTVTVPAPPVTTATPATPELPPAETPPAPSTTTPTQPPSPDEPAVAEPPAAQPPG